MRMSLAPLMSCLPKLMISPADSFRNYQDAFDAALNLDLNTNELAGFSLVSPKPRFGRVSAYEQFSGNLELGEEGDGKVAVPASY